MKKTLVILFLICVNQLNAQDLWYGMEGTSTIWEKQEVIEGYKILCKTVSEIDENTSSDELVKYGRAIYFTYVFSNVIIYMDKPQIAEKIKLITYAILYLNNEKIETDLKKKIRKSKTDEEKKRYESYNFNHWLEAFENIENIDLEQLNSIYQKFITSSKNEKYQMLLNEIELPDKEKINSKYIFESTSMTKPKFESFIEKYPNYNSNPLVIKIKDYYIKEQEALEKYNELVKKIENREYNKSSKVHASSPYEKSYTIIMSDVRTETLNYDVRKVLGVIADARSFGDNLIKNEYRTLIPSVDLADLMKKTERYLNLHYYGERKKVYN